MRLPLLLAALAALASSGCVSFRTPLLADLKEGHPVGGLEGLEPMKPLDYEFEKKWGDALGAAQRSGAIEDFAVGPFWMIVRGVRDGDLAEVEWGVHRGNVRWVLGRPRTVTGSTLAEQARALGLDSGPLVGLLYRTPKVAGPTKSPGLEALYGTSTKGLYLTVAQGRLTGVVHFRGVLLDRTHLDPVLAWAARPTDKEVSLPTAVFDVRGAFAALDEAFRLGGISGARKLDTLGLATVDPAFAKILADFDRRAEPPDRRLAHAVAAGDLPEVRRALAEKAPIAPNARCREDSCLFQALQDRRMDVAEALVDAATPAELDFAPKLGAPLAFLLAARCEQASCAPLVEKIVRRGGSPLVKSAAGVSARQLGCLLGTAGLKAALGTEPAAQGAFKVGDGVDWRNQNREYRVGGACPPAYLLERGETAFGALEADLRSFREPVKVQAVAQPDAPRPAGPVAAIETVIYQADIYCPLGGAPELRVLAWHVRLPVNMSVPEAIKRIVPELDKEKRPEGLDANQGSWCYTGHRHGFELKGRSVDSALFDMGKALMHRTGGFVPPGWRYKTSRVDPVATIDLTR